MWDACPTIKLSPMARLSQPASEAGRDAPRVASDACLGAQVRPGIAYAAGVGRLDEDFRLGFYCPDDAAAREDGLCVPPEPARRPISISLMGAMTARRQCRCIVALLPIDGRAEGSASASRGGSIGFSAGGFG